MRYKFLLIGLFLSTYIFAGQIDHTVSFNSADLTFTKLKGYDLVGLNRCGFSAEIGAPMLPQLSIPVLIPSGANITNVEVISMSAETLSGEYKIYPSQPPQLISFKRQGEWVEPNPDIYSQTTLFPEDLAKCSQGGNMGGYRIAGFLIYPLQYILAQKKLIFYSKLEIRITYKIGTDNKPQKTLKEKTIFGDIIKRMVVNPEMVKCWCPDISSGSRSKVLSPDTIEYVIITADSFASGFQPLADWKTKKGVPAKIVTLDSIYASYSGVDNAERIRKFIIDANSSWGAIWFLLGGQCDYENGQEIVPRRDVYYKTVGVGYYPDEDTIPSDLYFADLDGTWNADGDEVWGEKADSVDLSADVFVGRAPVRTTAQVQTFVQKVLTYEKNPPTGYLKKMLLPSAELTDYYSGDKVNNEIASKTPTGWEDIKLSEKYGTLSKTALVNAINSGIGFCHFAAHGRPDSIRFHDHTHIIRSEEVASLTNGNKLGIYNAICCLVGAIDLVPGGDCFAEWFLNAPNGGGVASIMNSRYGFVNTSYFSLSEKISLLFYDEVFYKGVHNLGIAHAISKNRCVSSVTWSSWWAWCIYVLNLFGDPELPMWTDEPSSLVVTHKDTLTVGETSFQVAMTSSKSPVDSALVCLLKEGEVYERDYTDATGNVTLTLSPPPAFAGTLYVTVTKHNYKPYEGEAFVKSASVDEISQVPKVFAICQNSPNPFSQKTVISYQLPAKTDVSLRIYDAGGRLVKTLVDGERDVGYYSVAWDMRDNAGKQLSSGIYFYRLEASEFTATRKLTIVQ